MINAQTHSAPVPSNSSVVLLVDDETSNLKVLSEALSGQGLSLGVATNGERALEQVKRRVPDLILLDVLMPTMDGFEVCRRLKSEPTTETIPVIFMTSLHDATDRVRAFELGAADYLTKPIYQEELRARVRTQLRLRTAMRILAAKNQALERAQKENAAALEEQRRTAAELRIANDRLDAEVARRTQELLDAKEKLEEELECRRRGDLEREQLQKQIIELSSPIIPVSDQILVMPLIGIIDETRAKSLLDSALHRVTHSRASVVILDITGVPRVNAEVARAIVDMARALRLLGAQTILSGIRPDVARTLLTVDVDLSGMTTQSTLQAAMEHAQRVLFHGGPKLSRRR